MAVAMKKSNELEDNWITEQEEEKIEGEETIDSISQANRQAEGFIFENKLGGDLTFYVQTMSGETKPEQMYKPYVLKRGQLLFISRNELKQVRKEESKAKYGQPLKLISEDMLRIMVRLKEWKFASDIPIELGGCHSFVFMLRELPSEAKYKQCGYPVICRVDNTVITYIINRNIIKSLPLNLI